MHPNLSICPPCRASSVPGATAPFAQHPPQGCRQAHVCSRLVWPAQACTASSVLEILCALRRVSSAPGANPHAAQRRRQGCRRTSPWTTSCLPERRLTHPPCTHPLLPLPPPSALPGTATEPLLPAQPRSRALLSQPKSPLVQFPPPLPADTSSVLLGGGGPVQLTHHHCTWVFCHYRQYPDLPGAGTASSQRPLRSGCNSQVTEKLVWLRRLLQSKAARPSCRQSQCAAIQLL